MTVKTGSLWKNKTWPEAIELSRNTPDCGICPVYSMSGTRIGTEIYGYGNGKRYHTRIPEKYNSLVSNIGA